MHAQLSSGARGLGLRLPLLSYFVHTRSKDYDETAQMHRLVEAIAATWHHKSWVLAQLYWVNRTHVKLLNPLCTNGFSLLVWYNKHGLTHLIYQGVTGSNFKIIWFFVWFDSLRPINNPSFIKGLVFLVWTSPKLGLIFLLKDTNAVTPVSLEPVAPQSRVKHSTTEPLHSLLTK